MPLYEYACRACGHRFEFLTHAGRTPSCPACAGADLEKQLSVFGVSGTAASASRGTSAEPCGTCGDPDGPGSCSIKYPTSSLH